MCYVTVLRDVFNLVIPNYVQQLWEKNLLTAYLFVFKGVRRCRGQVCRKLRSVRVFLEFRERMRVAFGGS